MADPYFRYLPEFEYVNRTKEGRSEGDYSVVKNFFSNYSSKFLFSIFIINAYFFSALSISEVFEDYIKNYKIKNVANRILYASAVVIPLITIILMSRL